MDRHTKGRLRHAGSGQRRWVSRRPFVPTGVPALLGLLAILLTTPPASATVPEVLVAGGDSLGIWVLIRWERVLPRFVEDRLRRGIPATVGLRADLVSDRSGWWDRRLMQAGHEWQLARDPWSEAFLMVDSAGVTAHDSLPGLHQVLAQQRLRVPLQRDWCDGRTGYRIEVTGYVIPLSARDADEVESWLKGQIRGLGRGILGIPKGLFGIVRDLSGLGERASKGRSPRFRMTALADGRVRVFIPGEEESPVGSRAR